MYTYTPPLSRSIIVLDKRIDTDNFLQHYGIKGQKWGVITKEYEPVQVDRRKTSSKPSTSMNQFNKTFMTVPTKNQKLVPVDKNKSRVLSKVDKYNIRLRKAAIIGTAVIGLLAAYGFYKYSKVTKAKAYSGLLNRFIQQNPNANVGTESGRQLLQKGIKLAESNSKRLIDAKNTNSYLKSRGLMIDKNQAKRIYSARRFIKRSANISSSGNAFKQTLNNLRKKYYNGIIRRRILG